MDNGAQLIGEGADAGSQQRVVCGSGGSVTWMSPGSSENSKVYRFAVAESFVMFLSHQRPPCAFAQEAGAGG